MPETLERRVPSDPAVALNVSLGWKPASETPLPDTVFVDGDAEAALAGRTATLDFPDYSADLLVASRLLAATRSTRPGLSQVVTSVWLESLSYAADSTRARLQLLRETFRFDLGRRLVGTQLSAERLSTVHPTAPVRLTALRAAREVKDWLGVSWDAVAGAADINPGTIHYWQGNPTVVPRPATVDDLYRLHASLAAARRTMTSDVAFNEWLHLGSASGDIPRELALRGDLDGLRESVQRLVFADASVAIRPISRRFAEDPEDSAPQPPASAAEPSRLRRKATRRPRARRT
jgi:hypothetical protein